MNSDGLMPSAARTAAVPSGLRAGEIRDCPNHTGDFRKGRGESSEEDFVLIGKD